MPSAKRVQNGKSKKSSAPVIAFNDDLLLELLLRLPIKSLLRFKCVCKQWLSLITDHRFTRRKYLMSNAVTGVSGVFSYSGFDYELVPVHPLKSRAPLTNLSFVDPPHHRITIISSCNGLLLCSSRPDFNNNYNSQCYIYNSATMQFRTLPPRCGQAAADGRVVGLGLAFDPPILQGYKVVCIQSRIGGGEIVVYSSETGRWRVSPAPWPLFYAAQFDYAVYCNGAIYWVHRYGASLCFDLEKEVAQEFPLPPYDSTKSIAYFGESRGHLHLIYDTRLADFPPVYEMESDRSGWVIKFRIDLTGLVSTHQLQRNLKKVASVLCVTRGGKKGDFFLVIHVPGKVISYNFGDKSHQVIYKATCQSKFSKTIQCNFSKQTQEVIGTRHAQKKSIGWPFVHKFMETLSPV